MTFDELKAYAKKWASEQPGFITAGDVVSFKASEFVKDYDYWGDKAFAHTGPRLRALKVAVPRSAKADASATQVVRVDLVQKESEHVGIVPEAELPSIFGNVEIDQFAEAIAHAKKVSRGDVPESVTVVIEKKEDEYVPRVVKTGDQVKIIYMVRIQTKRAESEMPVPSVATRFHPLPVIPV
jgi:hypothetical protein